MKTLFLLRHAKAESKETEKPDFERVLADKGLKQSVAMGKVMRENNIVPDKVYCSPANRTKETLEGVRQNLSIDTNTIYWEKIIYDGSTRDLMELVNTTNDSFKAVLLVGHNFAISDFYNKLTVQNGMLATADLVVINFEVDEWKAVGLGSGQLTSYYSSKDYI